MTITLDDAFEKLRWAKHHLEVLRPQVEAFEKRDAHRISVSIDHDAGEYAFYVHDLEVPNPDWGLLIGDCIHNARTALDYVAVRLWALVTGTDPSKIHGIDFPISSPDFPDPIVDDADVEKAFVAARDRFKAPATKFSKEPGFSGYLATIEQLQPFNRDNPSIWGTKPWGEYRIPRTSILPGALERLSRLDNIDKHRVPHATWASVDFFHSPDIGDIAPDDFESLGGSTANALEDGAEIGSWRFKAPLPHRWEPDEMDVKRCFPLQVALGEPGIFHGVLEVLELCLWGVEAVLIIFNPVFEHGQPPLPVTAIQDPRG